MDDLHKKGGKRKNYSFYWVGNTGYQPLWTPKWHLTLTNVQEEESKNTEAIPLDISKQVKINPWVANSILLFLAVFLMNLLRLLSVIWLMCWRKGYRKG